MEMQLKPKGGLVVSLVLISSDWLFNLLNVCGFNIHSLLFIRPILVLEDEFQEVDGSRDLTCTYCLTIVLFISHRLRVGASEFVIIHTMIDLRCTTLHMILPRCYQHVGGKNGCWNDLRVLWKTANSRFFLFPRISSFDSGRDLYHCISMAPSNIPKNKK